MLFTRRRHKNNLVPDFFVILLYTVFVFFSLIFFCKINTCVVIFLVVYDQRSNISCPRLCMSYITCRISCSSFSVWPIIMAKGKNGCRSTNETVSKAISTEIALMDQSRLENCTQMRCPLTLGKLFNIYFNLLCLLATFLCFSTFFVIWVTNNYILCFWVLIIFIIFFLRWFLWIWIEQCFRTNWNDWCKIGNDYNQLCCCCCYYYWCCHLKMRELTHLV